MLFGSFKKIGLQGLPQLFHNRRPAESAGVGLIVAVAALLLGLMLNPFLTVVNHDAAIFCILAQSILKGHYLLVSEPNPLPYFTFPPMLPLQLAGLAALSGQRDILALQPLFKGYIDLLFLCSLPLFYGWVRRITGRPRDAIILTGLLAINPLIYKYSSDVLSDTPYWAFSMGALYAAYRLTQADRDPAGKPQRWFLLSILLIIISALTRQIGMALVVTFIGGLIARRQWKRLLAATVLFACTVGAWQSYEHFYRSSHRSDIGSLNQQGVQKILDQSPIKLEYVKHFLVDRPIDEDQNRFQTSPAILLQNALERVDTYSRHTLDLVLPGITIYPDGQKTNLAHMGVFMVLLWVLVATGWLALVRAFPFGGAYLAVYMGVLLVYPYISPRFLLPVSPLILFCVYLGLQAAVHRLNPGTRPGSNSSLHPNSRGFAQTVAAVALPTFVLLALIAQLPDALRWVCAGYELKQANQGPSLRRGNRAYFETLLWIRRNTPENSLIISRKPPVTYVYSGRRSTAFPFTSRHERLYDYIRDKQRRYGRQFPFIYIFEDHVFGSSARYLQPVVERYRDRLSLVYTEPTTQSRVWLLK